MLQTPRASMLIAIVTMVSSLAQGQRGGPPPTPQTPQAAAPIDLTGYWVSLVTEDWRWRMVTPRKGDFASVPLNPEGLKVGSGWDPATDGSCLAYGAAGLMRMPTRLHITWENERTLMIQTDAGQQTRRFVFEGSPESSRRSLQGYSHAEWQTAGGRVGLAATRGPGAGSLKVVTTRLSGGWLRRNGAPYSEKTTLTEYYDRFSGPAGDEWFSVTTIVSDPTYLSQDFVTSTHFKREPDGSKWNATACK